MYPTRLINFLLLALGFVAVAQAIQPDHQAKALAKELHKRQQTDADASSPAPAPSPSPSDDNNDDDEPTTTGGDGGNASPSDTTTTTTDEEADDPTPSPTPDDNNDPTPEPSPSPSPTEDGNNDDNNSDSPSPSPGSPSPSSPDSTPTSASEGGNNGGGGDSASSVDQSDVTDSEGKTTASLTTPISTITEVITTRNSAGEEVVSTQESVSTGEPTLSANNDDDDGGSGMSKGTRDIVIGVVCGVGGAIVLGALGFLAWRLWGRKKRQQENDNLMDYSTAGTSAFNNEPKNDANSGSTGPAAGRSPFQTTLDSYHQPGQVNASSNF